LKAFSASLNTVYRQLLGILGRAKINSLGILLYHIIIFVGINKKITEVLDKKKSFLERGSRG